MFLNALRTAYPQFAQKARNGQGFAQQDAEEAWSQIVSQLRQNLKVKENADGTKTPAFVDRYMSGSIISTLSPPAEAAEREEPVTSTEAFLKLDCHIDTTINHLRDGLVLA